MNKIYLFLVFGLLLSSCEKTVDNVDIPQIDPELVVQSFLTQDEDSIILYLSWSVPIYGTYSYDFKDVENADVFITNNGNKMQLNYITSNKPYSNSGYYIGSTTSLKMKPKEKFNLEISESGGNHITSQTIIPEKPVYTISSFRVDSTQDEWSDFGYTYSYYYDFQGNNANDINYYTNKAIGYFLSPGFELDSMVLRNYSQKSEYLKIEKGESISMSFNSYAPLDSIKLMVLHTDKSYYEYHRTASMFSGDNPFSEPIIVYSNIENGLGVFCSYNSNSVMLRF